MKICHITITHDVFDIRIFKKQCVSLAKEGYEVSLIAPNRKIELISGIKIIPVLKWSNFYERVVKAPIHALKLALKIEADIYHFHDPELLPVMSFFAKKYNKIVVWDAHENYNETLYSLNTFKILPFSWLISKIFGWYEIWACKKVFSGVVTITDKMAKRYRNKNIKTCVLANYADISLFNYNHNENQISMNPLLISSGSHFRGRGILQIAKAFPLISKKIKASISFSGRFTDLNLQNKVIEILSMYDKNKEYWDVKGEISFDDLINKIIPKAWVGLVLFDTTDANNCNGLPNRLFELLANGVPVITTKGTETSNLVETINAGIIINENSPELIAEAFLKIAKNKSLRDKLSTNAYNSVKSKYNWQVNFNDLTEFYKKITS